MYNAELLTLSPLHIGDGEELIPFEYITENGLVKVYPFYYFIDKLYETYSDKDLLPKINLLKDYARAGLIETLKEFTSSAKVELKPKYILKVRSIPGREDRIKTFLKNLEGPYLPGSEIKGALRTVFLYGILQQSQGLKKFFLDRLAETVKIAETQSKKEEQLKAFDNLLRNLEAKVFRPGSSKEQNDAKYDLFKALQVSDSKALPFEIFYLDGVKTLNTSQNLIEYNELLKQGEKINLTFTLDKKITLEALETIGKLNGELNNKNLFKITLDFLKKSALDFYEKIIEIDEEYVKSKVKDPVIKNPLLEQLTKLKESFKKARQSNKYIIPLRLGKHQGYLSLTIMQIVKQENSALFERVFKLAVPQWRAEINKTRKVTLSEPKFLGWCFLVINAH